VAALWLGMCLFAIPYLALYVIPYFHEIRAIIGTRWPGGVGLSVRGTWIFTGMGAGTVPSGADSGGMAMGIPLLVFSTAILAAIRSTRGIAMAALPLQLGIFLLVWRKMPSTWSRVGTVCGGRVDRAAGAGPLSADAIVDRIRAMVRPVAVIALSVYLVETSSLRGEFV